MFLGRDFQNSWNGSIVVLQYVSNIVGNVLVDQNDTNIIPCCKGLEGIFNLLKFGILLANQKVGSFRSSVTNARQQKSSDSVLNDTAENDV